MTRLSLLFTSVSAALAGSLALAQTSEAPAIADFEPVTDEMLQNPDPADWLMWRRTLNHWGHSPLTQIDRGNVGNLALVWTRPLSIGVQEGTPLVYDGIMYFPGPSDVTQAIDATTGDLIWEYRRPQPDDAAEYFPVPSINRNLAIHGTLLFDNGTDNYAYALDARTGEVAWETQILDYRRGAQHTSGPIVANGKVISSRGCEPEGGPEACVITAFDADTGEELWRTRTIPAPGEPGDETWGDIPYEERKHVGAWMVPSFDPELNLVYVGTSVTSPAPKFMLAGNDEQYLYHNSTLALNADTGEIEWYFQHVVDHWDLDHPFERLIVDTVVAPDPDDVTWINPRVRSGETRKVLTGIPGKTGVVYTLDRETGQFLWARPTIHQNVIEDINVESGAATVNPDTLFTAAGQERLVCPALTGGKNYPTGTYSPDTGLMYYPLQNTCSEMTSTSETPSPDDLYAVRGRDQIAPGERNVGTIEAIDVSTGATAWKIENRSGTTSLMSTAGGLVFGGDVAGRFRAYDASTGEVLWEVNLGSSVTGFPVTFEADGRQYVAISTGATPNSFGVTRLTPELRPGTANNLYVFALPE
ncbi:MAG: PQQ-binding-like beta-propeller repeat protein [Gammaproteobacteria bacterium]|nr:PQQ-binding-like beta-propeller repeat protein [Gammaproteobacteria bacterium]